jgi:hypothetical protein
VNLGNASFDVDWFAVRAGGHVAEGERAGKWLWGGLELAEQHLVQAALLSLNVCARVMGYQSAEHLIGALDVPKIPGAVELMHAATGQLREVPDVV